MLAGCGGGGDSAPDAATPDAAPPDAAPLDASLAFPEWLSQAGLSDAALSFTPRYTLWADGADKQRWIVLPAGAAVDQSDPDHWRFPVGTRFFKQFSLGGRALETRLILRTGPGSMDYRMGAYVWLADGSDARLAPAGAKDVLGTAHDVPSMDDCWACHLGEPGRILGYSQLQLGPTPAPGDAVTARALGWLHANCGHCHNENGIARPDVDMILRLGVGEDVASSGAYRTAVGQRLTRFTGAGFTLRIAPGDPAMSGLFHRMSTRGNSDQMPPIASELVDPDGVDAVGAWIRSLPPP